MLSIKNLNNKNVNKAAEEVLKNAQYLLLSGDVEAAYLAVKLLVSPGPWKVRETVGIFDEIHRFYTLVCWMSKKDLPSFEGYDGLSFSELDDEANDRSEGVISELLLVDRLQLEPAGANWGDEYFKQLSQMNEEAGIFKDYGEFVNQLDWLVKSRLKKKISKSPSSKIFEALKGFLPFDIDGEIKISETSDRYETHWLAEKLISLSNLFNEKIGSETIGYMEERIHQSVLVMDILDGEHHSSLLQFKQLQKVESLDSVLELCYWQPFKEWVLAGEYRSAINVSGDDVREYLGRLNTRSVDSLKNTKKTSEPSSAQSVDYKGYQKLVAGSILEGLDSCELEIPESKDNAIAIKIDRGNGIEQWRFAHELLSRTQRWPVLHIGWSSLNDSRWKSNLIEDNPFDRYVFGSEDFLGDRIGLTPSDIVAGAEQIDFSSLLTEVMREREGIAEENLDYQLEELENEEVVRKKIFEGLDEDSPNRFLEASLRLFDVELETNGEPTTDLSHISWFEPSESESLYLLLLPTLNSWEVPAYIQWYGAETLGSELVVAQLKRWNVQYGAEIVCHYGTMLQLQVTKKPQSLQEAFRLAYMQDFFAQCTCALPGVSIGEHALALMKSDRWFLHERP